MINPALPPNLPPPKVTDDTFSYVAALLGISADPKMAQKHLAELKAAVAEHKAAGDKLAADRADYDHHRHKTEAEWNARVADRVRRLDEREDASAKHQAAVESELIGRERRVSDAEARVANATIEAEKMRAEAKRRLSVLEGN